jgi:hypothetical protein
LWAAGPCTLVLDFTSSSAPESTSAVFVLARNYSIV